MVTIKNSLNINRSPEDVFTFVTDPANQPKMAYGHHVKAKSAPVA